MIFVFLIGLVVYLLPWLFLGAVLVGLGIMAVTNPWFWVGVALYLVWAHYRRRKRFGLRKAVDIDKVKLDENFVRKARYAEWPSRTKQ